MYKISDYTLIKTIGTDTYIVNTFTGSVGKIDDNLKDKLENYDINSGIIDSSIMNILKKNGFIVPNQLDEYQKILDLEKKAIFNESDTLIITIATTMKCNYSCKYCFEPIQDRRKLFVMDEKTTDIVIKYIKEKLNKSFEKLVITWFGGEPLLGMDAIEKISNNIIPFCDEKSIDFRADIITNGYFLTEKISKKLHDNFRVSSAQITLDGPEEIYETVKSTPKGAYKRVLNNIRTASELINIKVRLNIAEENYPIIEEYVESLMNYLGDSNVKIYLAEVCDDWVDYCEKKVAKTTKYWQQHKQFQKSIKSKYPNALATNKLPIAYCGAKCGMIKKHNVIIGPHGELYRCDHMVGRENEIIGTCEDGLYHNQADKKFDSFEHPSYCKSCKIFPICMTGCPNDIIEGKIRVPCDIKIDTIIDALINQTK